VSNLKSNIQIRNLFGNQDNICYEICDCIAKCYNDLLIDQLESVFIVTRHDNAIKLSRKASGSVEDKNIQDKRNNNSSIIIKIDGVLAEINISKLHGTQYKNLYKYPLYLGGLIFIGWAFHQTWKSIKLFDCSTKVIDI
jgi:hypothetical protein